MADHRQMQDGGEHGEQRTRPPPENGGYVAGHVHSSTVAAMRLRRSRNVQRGVEDRTVDGMAVDASDTVISMAATTSTR